MAESEINYSEYFKNVETQNFSDDEYAFYDEIDIKDMEFNLDTGIFTFPCPCGDLFQVTLDDLKNGEVVARCPSCSLIVCVIYESEDLEKY